MDSRFKDQAEFTQEVLTSKGECFPLTLSSKINWTKEYILYILSECNDLLEQLDWKTHWSTNSVLIESNVGIEIIDIQKFVWGLAKIWNIDLDKFNEMYDLKTAAVRSKWSQENLLTALRECDRSCIIDIDGVLTPYPEYFISWVKKNYNEDIDKNNIVRWEYYKHLYRESGDKANAPFFSDSREALRKLAQIGYTIVLLTNRPASKYKRIYSDTLKWLQGSQIPYNYIFWTEDRKVLEIIKKCPTIKFIVDDSLETCQEFRSAGIKAYHYGSEIKSLLDIDELIRSKK